MKVLVNDDLVFQLIFSCKSLLIKRKSSAHDTNDNTSWFEWE